MNLNMERVLYKALKKCCQYMRENPPGDLDNLLKQDGMINILAGGGQRDPEGTEWVQYWLDLAIQEIREEEKINDARKVTSRDDCCDEE